MQSDGWALTPEASAINLTSLSLGAADQAALNYTLLKFKFKVLLQQRAQRMHENLYVQ